MKYYICPECGNLTTDKELLEEASRGGSGMCYCKYDYAYFDDVSGEFLRECTRDLIQYIQISKYFYEVLGNERNHAIRLDMFRTIAPNRRV